MQEIDNKDYIYIIDDAGYAYILKRDGTNRIKIKKEIPMSDKNNFFIDNIGNIFSSNLHGNIFKIYLNGDVKILYENNFNNNHLFVKLKNKESFICINDKKIFLF